MIAAALLLAAATASVAAPKTLTVCPANAAAQTCQYKGDGAIQAAVDAAHDGDTIIVKAGRYTPAATRDVPFQNLAIRGYVVVANKRLSIVGEDGAVLDGATGKPSIAFVFDHADVGVRNLTIRNFRYGEPEDKIYDGHGIFAINSRVEIDRVRMEKIIKMAITGRGDTTIEASNIQLLDGHMGVWLEESAHATLRNAVIRGGDSAGVGGYMQSSMRIYNSVIEGNGDDGVYAAGDASIFVTNSLILRNRPFGVRGIDASRIFLTHSVLFGNEANLSSTSNKEQVRTGDGIIEADPRIDANYRPAPASPILGKGDPDVGGGIGLRGER